MVRAASAAGEPAEQLAARSRDLRVFPAAIWFPHAQAVLSASQPPPSGRGLPPAAPPLSYGQGPLSVSIGASVPRAATPPPPLSYRPDATQRAIGPTLPSASDEGDRSSDMDEDALVAAYITPPISPSASPGTTRPSSERSRRSSAARAPPHIAAAAATPASQAEHEPAATALRDLHQAVRNGFSSVRRELTRLRSELVVLKSQSASVLRRMDGIAAASDGSESGNGVVLEHLTRLERVFGDLGDRLSVARAGDGSANIIDTNSTTVIGDIKVCSRASLGVLERMGGVCLLTERDACHVSRERAPMWQREHEFVTEADVYRCVVG